MKPIFSGKHLLAGFCVGMLLSGGPVAAQEAILPEVAEIRTKYAEQAQDWPETPEHIKAAIVAVNDPDFHDGALALSPITGLVSRNFFLRRSRELFRDTALQVRLAEALTPDEMLNFIAQSAYFRRLCFGVEKAAPAIWQQPVSELNLSQAIFLALIAQAPGKFDAGRDERALREAHDQALSHLIAAGYISDQDAEHLSGQVELPPEDWENCRP